VSAQNRTNENRIAAMKNTDSSRDNLCDQVETLATKLKANEQRRTKWLREVVTDLEANNGRFEESVLLTKEELKRDQLRRIH